jgi:hypothetical protein
VLNFAVAFCRHFRGSTLAFFSPSSYRWTNTWRTVGQDKPDMGHCAGKTAAERHGDRDVRHG